MIILQKALKIRDFKIVDVRVDTILRGPVTRCKSNDLFSMTVNLFDFYLCFPGSCKQGKGITGPPVSVAGKSGESDAGNRS